MTEDILITRAYIVGQLGLGLPLQVLRVNALGTDLEYASGGGGGADDVGLVKENNALVNVTARVLNFATASNFDVTDNPGQGTVDVSIASGAITDTLLASNAVTTAKILDDNVTYAKIQNVSATSRFLGRISGGAGNIEELTGTQSTTLLDTFTDLLKGLAPASGGGTANFLRADGTWAAPSAGASDNVGIVQEAGSDVNTVARKLNFAVASDFDVTDDAGNGQVDVQIAALAIATSHLQADAVTFAKIQNISTDRLLGRDTAASGDTEEITVGGGIEFTGSGGIQTSAFTGDVTKAAGGTSTTIANNAVTTAKILDDNVTFAKMQEIATDRLIGRDTAGTGNPEELTASGGIEFTGTGIQRSALTGDVTASAGSNSTTIANDAVTYAKMQNVSAASKLLGRGDSGSGDPQEITLGTNLSMSGTTLNASGGGSSDNVGIVQENGIDVNSVVRKLNFAVSSNFDVVDNAGGTVDVDIADNAITTALINADAVTFAKIQNITTDRLLGRDTAGSGDTEEISLDDTLEFTGSGSIQRAALTGDITASAGDNTTAIAAGVIVDADINASGITTRSKLPSAIAYEDEANTFTQTQSVNAILDAQASIQHSGDITPTALAADTNDYNPSGLSTASVIRLDGDGNNLTGLAGGADGRIITIISTGVNGLNIMNEDAGSSAANRFLFFQNVPGSELMFLYQNMSVTFIYDGTSQRWRPIHNAIAEGQIQPANIDPAAPFNLSFGNLHYINIVTPAAITTNTNNYNPTGLSIRTVFRISSDASRNITGLVAQSSGRLIILYNVGTNDIVLTNQDTNSTAANRFLFNGDITLKPDQTVSLWYDSTTSRWRLFQPSLYAGSILTAHLSNDQVTFAKMQNITTDRLLGRDTASSGDVEEIALNSTLEFDGSLNLRRAALTGDVTATAGSNSTTIANDAVTTAKILDANVTYAKIQDISAASKLLGRGDSGSGDVQEITLGSGLTMTGTTLSSSGGSADDAGIIREAGSAVNAAARKLNFSVATDFDVTDDAGNGEVDVKIANGAITDALVNASGITTRSKLPSAIAYEDEANTFTQTQTTSGLLDIGAHLHLTGDITPASLTDNVNDYNPTGLSTATRIRQQADFDVNITGLAGGADGRVIILTNISGTGIELLINHEDTNSTAANRFDLPGDTTIALQPDDSVTFIYDSTISRWRFTSGTALADNVVNTWNIVDDAVTNLELANMAANTIKGNDTASSDDPRDIAVGTNTVLGRKGSNIVAETIATAQIGDDQVTYAKIQNVSAASKLLGRGDSGSGDVQEITLGTNLSMSGTTLNATGGGGGDAISVNGTAATDADFDDATPAAPTGTTNVKWQKDAGTPNNISAYVELEELPKRLLLTGDISITLTANQNDWNPTGLSTASVIRLTGDGGGTYIISGLQGGADGRIIIIRNVDPDSDTFVLTNEDSNSSAANRFSFGSGEVEINLGESITLIYDSTASRWKPLNSSIVESSILGAHISTNAIGTTHIADNAVTFAEFQNINTDRLLGRDTAASGDPEEISLNSTLEFTGSQSIQRAALTGDVTASAGSNTTDIASGVVGDAEIGTHTSTKITITAKGQLNSSIAYEDEANIFSQEQTISENVQTLLKLFRPASTTNNKVALDFEHRDSASNEVTYASIDGEIFDSTNGSEDGILNFSVRIADALTLVGSFDEVGRFRCGGSNRRITLVETGLTATRTYTFPDATALLAGQNFANSFTAAQSVAALLDAQQDIRWSGDISPSQITANQNDYNPTNLATSTVLRLTSDASRNITGLQGGADGRIITIINVGSNNIVLTNQDTASSAANRFDIGTNRTIRVDHSIVLIYDSTDSRWRPIGGTGDAETCGTATGSADGAATVFNIAHGLGSTPSHALVLVSSVLGSTINYSYALDSTNIAVTFASAPSAGTITFHWRAVA